jgi:hypothetical protein
MKGLGGEGVGGGREWKQLCVGLVKKYKYVRRTSAYGILFTHGLETMSHMEGIFETSMKGFISQWLWRPPVKVTSLSVHISHHLAMTFTHDFIKYCQYFSHTV